MAGDGRGDALAAPSGFAGLTGRFDLAKPLIAAVNGVAMGGGFEIALACDLIVASEAAVFALPEPRVGLAALAGGLHRLPRAIGVKRALGMILTARRVGAAEGKELGFVHEVVPAAELMAAARKLAADICVLGPLSIRASKAAVFRGPGRAVAGSRDQGAGALSGGRRPVQVRGFRRGPARLRPETSAGLEGALVAATPETNTAVVKGRPAHPAPLGPGDGVRG